MLWLLVPFTAFAIFVDYGRYYIGWVNKYVQLVFGPILREHENDDKKKLLSGGSYVVISACLCIIIFPKVIAITAFTILIVSDATGALLGRKFGKRKFFDKSLEGSIAFFISALIVVLVMPKIQGLPVEFWVGALAALVGTIIEAMSIRLKLDDNFSVPCTVGLTMWVAYFILAHIGDPAYEVLYRQLMQ